MADIADCLGLSLSAVSSWWSRRQVSWWERERLIAMAQEVAL
jgi:predicted transcriptional regulator